MATSPEVSEHWEKGWGNRRTGSGGGHSLTCLWIGGSLAPWASWVSPRMSTRTDPLCPGAAAVPAVQPEAGMGTLLLAPAQAGQGSVCSGATAGQVGRWPGKVLPSPLCLGRVRGQVGLQSLDVQKCRAAAGVGLCCSAKSPPEHSSAAHHRSYPRPSSPSLRSPGLTVKVSACGRCAQEQSTQLGPCCSVGCGSCRSSLQADRRQECGAVSAHSFSWFSSSSCKCLV